MPKPPSQPLLIADVAKRFGVTTTQVARLDGELRPARTPGGVRVYRADAIDYHAAERAQRKANR